MLPPPTPLARQLEWAALLSRCGSVWSSALQMRSGGLVVDWGTGNRRIRMLPIFYWGPINCDKMDFFIEVYYAPPNSFYDDDMW